MSIFETMRQEIKFLIPSSLLDVACFTLYDNHPRDERKLDITVCTMNGEIREYCQRNLQSSLNLNCDINKTSKLSIFRNKNSELFYLLASNEELFIISSTDKLTVHKKITNIERYDVNDSACRGETYLKIIGKDDAVPLLFDSNFESLEDHGVILNSEITEDHPALNMLKRKLVEARYSGKWYETTYAQYVNLHQKALLLSCQSQQPATNSSIFQDKTKCIKGVLQVKTNKPIVKVCNKKMVVMFNVLNQSTDPVQNLHILIHNPSVPSLVYTTKLFCKTPTPPYWVETDKQINPGQEYVIATVINLDEFIHNALSIIELSGSLAYVNMKLDFLIPFEDVIVSPKEIMSGEIDVLANCRTDNYSFIAILAASEKTELCLRHIKQSNYPDTVLDLFCTHLQMDRVENATNVILYRKSPYHILNGTLIIFHEKNPDNSVPVSVHTRTSSQVVTLLHCIYDAVPAKIVLTTPQYKITAKADGLSQYNEDISPRIKELNYKDYATSMLNRSTNILEHLDSSIVKMNENTDPVVRRNIGTHIDLFAVGVEKLNEFRDCVRKEGEVGVNSLMKLESDDVEMENLEKSEQIGNSQNSDTMNFYIYLDKS